MAKIRISETQSSILQLLLAIEQNGINDAVPSKKLYSMVVKSWRKMTPPDESNYRKSAKLLFNNGFLELQRDSSLKMYFNLTDTGREKAIEIAKKKQEEAEKE